MSDYNKNKYKNEIKKIVEDEKMQTVEPADKDLSSYNYPRGGAAERILREMQTVEPADKDLISKDNESSYNYPKGGAVERILKEVESSRENQFEKNDIQYGVQV